jgi:hypothetical protein
VVATVSARPVARPSALPRIPPAGNYPTDPRALHGMPVTTTVHASSRARRAGRPSMVCRLQAAVGGPRRVEPGPGCRPPGHGHVLRGGMLSPGPGRRAGYPARVDGPVVTVSAPDGTALATVTVRDGEVRVEPPQAAGHPLVAAVASRMREGAGRPRRRPSC